MSEYLQRDVEYEGLLECLHGLTGLHRAAFVVPAESDARVTLFSPPDNGGTGIFPPAPSVQS